MAPQISKALAISDIIASKALEYGVDGQLAKEIAFCESTLRQFNDDGQVLRGLHNPDDVGIFQVNEKYHLEKSRSLGFDIYTTEGNIEYAMWLIKHEGIRHWNWSRPCWG